MKRTALLSQARHGTNYFINNLWEGDNINKIRFEYELLIGPSDVKESLIDLKKRYPDVNVEYFSNLRAENERGFFNEITNLLEENLKKEGINHFGFKIFPLHVGGLKHSLGGIKNRIYLEGIIDYFDNFIILDRSNLEFARSYLKAELINNWAPSKRFMHIDFEPKSNDYFNKLIRIQIDSKLEFFEKAKSLIEAKSKPILMTHYDNLGHDSEWVKISNFLNVKITKQIPFEKINYDYSQFLELNPEFRYLVAPVLPM